MQPVIEEPVDDIAEKLDNLQIVEAADDDVVVVEKVDFTTKFTIYFLVIS